MYCSKTNSIHFQKYFLLFFSWLLGPKMSDDGISQCAGSGNQYAPNISNTTDIILIQSVLYILNTGCCKHVPNVNNDLAINSWMSKIDKNEVLTYELWNFDTWCTWSPQCHAVQAVSSATASKLKQNPIVLCLFLILNLISKKWLWIWCNTMSGV